MRQLEMLNAAPFCATVAGCMLSALLQVILKDLYEAERLPGATDEFLGYRILYCAVYQKNSRGGRHYCNALGDGWLGVA